jgi:cyclophilin family peptidyl-prolyl cis-trans isomerase
VANFIKLATSKFYDGTTFHRVVPGFVIQGGDPNTKPGATGEPGTGGPGYTIDAEVGPTNPEKHTPGTLAMARSMDINSAGSQFYITLAATPNLDGGYTVFGRCVADADLALCQQVAVGDRMTVEIVQPAAPADAASAPATPAAKAP